VPERESASQNGSSEKQKHSDSDDGTSKRALKDAVPPASVAQAHGTQLPATNGKDFSEFRIDERTDEQLELVVKRRRLVRLQIEDGMTAREALEKVGLDCTPRSARMLKQKFQEQGILGIVDKRWLRRPGRSVLVKDVQVLIKKWYAGRRAAGPTAIARKVRKECRERDLPEPSDSAVRTFLDELPMVEKLFLRDQLDEWDQQGRPVVRVERAHRANEIWQIDHTTLNIWVRLRCGEEWIAVRPYLTGIVDVYSRSIPGFFVSTAHPDAWSVTLAVRHAVSAKAVDGWFNHGLPDRVQHDRGSDFMSHMLQGWFADQNVEVVPNPPKYPNETGIVERFFGTLDRGCLRLLPGHIDAVGTSQGAADKQIDRLLTRQQLKGEITRFVIEEYHHWHHREIDSKPAIRWEEGMGIPRMPAQGDLNSLILKHPDERTVTRTGIQFNIDEGGGRYWCPALCEHWKRTVRIGYNPEDLESVLVYASDTGEYLCEAWIMGHDDSKYDIGDIKRTRNQFRRGLKQRTAKYRREVEEEDRRKAREAAALEMAEKVESEDHPSNPPEGDDREEEVEQLMEELNRAMGE
jgi:putative transposase